MRLRSLIAVLVALAFATSPPAAAAPPDEAFSQAHMEYMQAKAAEFLAPYKGDYTGQQLTQAWCKAAHFWKMANPGGEARLTMKVLLQFRRLQWMCGQKIKRAPPLPDEDDPTPPPTDSDPDDKSEGGNGAVEDFMRWHPEEFSDAPSEEDYIRRRLFWWEWMGEGKKLAEEAMERQKQGEENPWDRYGEAEDEEIEKARKEWAAKHPGEDGDYDGDLRVPGSPNPTTYGEWRYDPNDGQGPYAKPFDKLTPEQKQEHYEWEKRTADGSVDPLDKVPDRTGQGSVDPLDWKAWARAVQPIVVGKNSQVGSGAQMKQAAVGAIAGALGVGGEDGGGPKVENCRFEAKDMQTFDDPRSGVQMRIGARRNGANLVVCSQVVRSPDQGTFQAVYVQDPRGQQQAPNDVAICRLYGQWSLSVGWTRSTYRDGALTSRETGGWQRQGGLSIPGLSPQSDAIWKQLGFSNASRGAQMARFRFKVTPQEMAQGLGVAIHITRPGQDPVVTVPFALVMREGPKGFAFERPGG